MTKIGLRNAWFFLHKWTGLTLAILIIPLCLTGSALVWHDALDRLVNPARYAVSGTATLAPPAYVAAAMPRLKPGERIVSLQLPEEPGGPVVVSGAPPPAPAAGPPPRTNIYLDPPTARVLDVANSRSGAIMVMHRIHGSLLVPGVGRQVVGWIGVAMLLSSISGLWLWWPTVGRWVRGLRWRRHRNLDTNLHHLMGFWIALPLFVLSLTGAWIAFPAFFDALSGEGTRRRGAGPDRAALARARPLERPATPLDLALASAGPGVVTQVSWPTDLKPAWSIVLKPASGRTRTVAVVDASGLAERGAGPDRDQSGTGRLMRRIHDGTGMGAAWQIVIFLGGLLPALLALTGVIMWWRARGWKAAVKARHMRTVAATD